jgi:catechol 2,3-dioxygenase-like lactoylglutathione lyase family enzyme
MKCIALLLAASLVTLAEEPARPRILGVAHIALFAHDFEKSRAFYRDFLGYEEPFSLKNPDGSPIMTFFKVNDRQYIELSPEKEPNTDRLNHISIQTDNAEAMRLYLASKGIKVPEKTPKGRIGNSNFTVKDPDGHGLEIVQYEPDGWTMREQGKHMSDARVSKHMMHVGIIVTDLDRANKFYGDVLGLKEIWRGSKDGKTLSWTNMKVPDGDDYIEFMLYKEPPAPTKRGSAHHLCLEVPDAAATVAALDKKPYRKDYTRPLEIRTGTNRKRQVNIFDPDGTRTEVMEPTTIDGKPAPSSTAPPPQD